MDMTRPTRAPLASIVAILGLMLSSSACSLANGEPSERQMHEAVQARFTRINSNLAELAARCRARDFGNNPIVALQCMQVCAGAANESCDLSFELTEFHKIACRESTEQPGYICDFTASLSSSGPFVQKAFDAFIGSGGTNGQGRFVKSEGEWLFMPISES